MVWTCHNAVKICQKVTQIFDLITGAWSNLIFTVELTPLAALNGIGGKLNLCFEKAWEKYKVEKTGGKSQLALKVGAQTQQPIPR